MHEEYGYGSKPSTKGDVYSYGVMLLEMITGKSPLEQSFGGDMDLTKWVRDNFPRQAHDVVDKRLISAIMDAISEGVQESNTEQLLLNCLLVPMMEVALSCVAQSPDKRNSMHDSLLRLKQMKETYLRNRSTMCRTRRVDVYIVAHLLTNKPHVHFSDFCIGVRQMVIPTVLK
jgi:serine/threonine protein kinase